MRYRKNTMNTARLGLIVSKKIAKFAVRRNYMRRVMRELFRLNQQQLAPIDLIIQIQLAFNKSEYKEIKQEFENLIQKLGSKVA